MRSEEQFELFWKYVELRSSEVDVLDPALPRRKRVPRRYEEGQAAPEYPSTVEDHYRRIYLEVLDFIIAAIKDRFQQRGFQMLGKLELMLKQGTPSTDLVKEICDFYGSDLNRDRLLAQLISLHSCNDDSLFTDLKSIVVYLKDLDAVGREFYSEVVKVMKLILVMPATNALSERSFSALRRIKTWLRTRMDQARLNWCMTLHVHKVRTDALSIPTIANEFVQRNSSRLHIFGKF